MTPPTAALRSPSPKALGPLFCFITIENRSGRFRLRLLFERIIIMNDRLGDLDQMAEENFAYEVSDEMLETAAGMEMGKPKAATVSFCSGLSVCPG